MTRKSILKLSGLVLLTVLGWLSWLHWGPARPAKLDREIDNEFATLTEWRIGDTPVGAEPIQLEAGAKTQISGVFACDPELWADTLANREHSRGLSLQEKIAFQASLRSKRVMGLRMQLDRRDLFAGTFTEAHTGPRPQIADDGTVTFEKEFQVPERPGRYLLRFDLYERPRSSQRAFGRDDARLLGHAIVEVVASGG